MGHEHEPETNRSGPREFRVIGPRVVFGGSRHVLSDWGLGRDVVERYVTSTQTVIISRPSLSWRIYAQGSESKFVNPFSFSRRSNSLFHSRPDCFRPYNVLCSQHTRCVPSPKPSGCRM